MDSLAAFLAALLIFLIIFTALLLFHYSRIQTKSMETLSLALQRMSDQNQTQMKLIWKTSTLLASKDPMTYQMIQSMEEKAIPEPGLEPAEENLADFYASQFGDVTDEEALNEIERNAFASPG